jgi:hypothetical protein
MGVPLVFQSICSLFILFSLSLSICEWLKGQCKEGNHSIRPPLVREKKKFLGTVAHI